MFRLLIEKELKEIIQSPKYVVSFIIFSALILLSIYVGIKEYKEYEKNYNTSISLMNTQISNVDTWLKVYALNNAFRNPNPMQILSSGIHNDIGRYSSINPNSMVKLQKSVFSEEPIYAVFRYVDFAMIVTIVLPLFAILFSYDSINGERENGTLRMVFSNPVPRNIYILAKCIGSWLGLVFSIMIPILFGMLMLVIFNIPITAGDWLKIAMLLFISLVYFSFFLAFGILISTFTKSSATSFMVLLVCWIVFVFILPRVGIMTAGQLYNVPSEAMIESQKSAFRTQRYMKFREDSRKLITNYQNDLKNGIKDISNDQREDYIQKIQSKLQSESENIRKSMDNDIASFEDKLNETVQNAKDNVETVGLFLSRLSPSSLYQLAAMNLCGTDINMKKRYETAMKEYRLRANEYIQKKINDTQIEYYIAMQSGRTTTIETKDMPTFTAPNQSFSMAVTPAIMDICILIILTMLIFASSYLKFLKYDLR